MRDLFWLSEEQLARIEPFKVLFALWQHRETGLQRQ